MEEETCELCHEQVTYCECRRCTECEELQLVTAPMLEDGSCSGCEQPARDCLCDDETCRKCGAELY